MEAVSSLFRSVSSP